MTLQDVAAAREHLAERRAAARLAEEHLAEAVREALAAGERPTDVAEAAGVSRSRLHQIRHGTR